MAITRWGPSWYKRPKAPTLGAAPKAPTQPKAPAPFVPAAPPAAPKATAPPAPTLTSASDRTGAREGYGTIVADVNAQARNYAANYGLAPSVVQYGWNPEGTTNAFGDTSTELVTPGFDPTHPTPGSTGDVLLRNLQGSEQNIDETAMAGNAYFSGRRVDQRGKAETDYGAQIAQAKRDYDEAMRQLGTTITSGRSSRDTTFRNADIADIQAAAAVTPEAQAPDPTPAAPAAAPPPAPGTLEHAQLAGGTGFAGLQQGKQYKTDSKGDLVVWNPIRKMWVLA